MRQPKEREKMGKLLGALVFVGAVLLFAVSVTTAEVTGQHSGSALPGSEKWLLDGNCVTWNNTNGVIRVCPHTLTRSGWVTAQFTNNLAAEPLSFAFGMQDARGISVRRPQIWQNVNHDQVVDNCTAVEVQVLNNSTPEIVERHVCNPYTRREVYPEWTDIGSLTTAADGEKMWHARDALWDEGTTMTARVWIDVERGSGLHKYDVLMKKGSENMAQAMSSGRYVLLDPWIDSPPNIFNETFDNGAFINITNMTLNISRGYLILNASGANNTNVLLNTSATNGKSCWNSSADPGHSEVSYNACNLQDGVISNADVSAVWATKSPPSFPEWAAWEIAGNQKDGKGNQYYWLYNFSWESGIAGQDGRNPANWSLQVPDDVMQENGDEGEDNSANWGYAQFNYDTESGTAPDVQGIVFGPVKTNRHMRWHITKNNVASDQPWISEAWAYATLFKQSGMMTSVILNDTVSIGWINVTCANVTGAEPGVSMNVTVMDKDFNNEQTVQCNDDSDVGVENDITDITGLIYRVNFSAAHNGLTPALDFLTLRIRESTANEVVGEADGDDAINAAIEAQVPGAARYKTQKVHVVNASNSQWQGTVDYLVVQNNPERRWLLNYITAGESYLNASNLSSTVYVLEMENKTYNELRDRMATLLSDTRG